MSNGYWHGLVPLQHFREWAGQYCWSTPLYGLQSQFFYFPPFNADTYHYLLFTDQTLRDKGLRNFPRVFMLSTGSTSFTDIKSYAVFMETPPLITASDWLDPQSLEVNASISGLLTSLLPFLDTVDAHPSRFLSRPLPCFIPCSCSLLLSVSIKTTLVPDLCSVPWSFMKHFPIYHLWFLIFKLLCKVVFHSPVSQGKWGSIRSLFAPSSHSSPFLGLLSLRSFQSLRDLFTHACELSPFRHIWLFVSPWTVACQVPLCPQDSPGKNTGVSCHFLSRGSFQPRNQTHISCIGRCVLYHYHHLRSPDFLIRRFE